MDGRKRTVQIKFRVTEAERDLILEKMKLVPTRNMAAYEIIKAVMLENGRGFALGHNPAAPSPYVTWACYDDKDGQRQYEWGHYGSDRAALEQDFAARVQEYQRLYNVGIK